MRYTVIVACTFLWSVGPSTEWGLVPGRLHRYITRQEMVARMRVLGSEKFMQETENVRTKGFDQKLDHFTAPGTWSQRYSENFQFYGKNELIFLKIGGESDISERFLTSISFMNRQAQKFKAAMFQLEHRFYGPVWPTERLNLDGLKYLSVDQALEDIAYFIKQMNALHNFKNPTWIVFGDSYAGSLAAWVRLKHPKLVHAAVASSAPLYAKTNFPEYYQTVTNSLYNIYGQKCTRAIQEAFKSMRTNIRDASKRREYKMIFNLCHDIDDTPNDIESFFESAATPFAEMVQSYWPSSRAPNVKSACDLMTNTAIKDPVARLAEVAQRYFAQENQACMPNKYAAIVADLGKPIFINTWGRQWVWQTCTEFGWFQTSNPELSAFGEIDLKFYTDMCKDIFGEEFDKAAIDRRIKRTNEKYHGYNIQVTNVVFVQGSLDPWFSAGIFMNPPQGSFAILIRGTSHCADTFAAESFDPPGLQKAQIKISELLAAWVVGKNPKSTKTSFEF